MKTTKEPISHPLDSDLTITITIKSQRVRPGEKSGQECTTQWIDPRVPPERNKYVLVELEGDTPFAVLKYNGMGKWFNDYVSYPTEDIIGWREIYE